MRTTRQRSAIKELLKETNEFLSAQRIHDLLHDRGDTVGLATVYRNLQSMADAGMVDVLRPENSDLQLFRYCKHDGHHHHLFCRACGKTVEITIAPLEELTIDVAKRHSFTEVSHDLEIYGLCETCSA